jgi:hypothetical protein
MNFPIAPLFILSFLVLLIVGRLLRGRGKHSESWAILTYGSWLIPPSMMFFRILFETGMSAEARLISAILLVLFVSCATVGIRAALRNRWGEMIGWWLGTIPLVMLTLLFLVPLKMQ